MGRSLVSGLTAALAALTKSLAHEIAPVRVNLIATGFIDTALPEATDSHRLNAHQDQQPPAPLMRQVLGQNDIAALAVHLMTNTAITGATVEIDGRRQLAHQYA